jgi:hypothetical protein
MGKWQFSSYITEPAGVKTFKEGVGLELSNNNSTIRVQPLPRPDALIPAQIFDHEASTRVSDASSQPRSFPRQLRL